MKKIVKLANIIDHLPESVSEGIREKCDENERKIEDCDVKRARAKAPKIDLEEGSRTALQYVSTRHLDRDKEIVVPSGIDLTEFRKAPQVLLNHDMSQPPIGSDESINADDFGLLALTKYATTDRGDEVFRLKQEGHMMTSSIGFIPLAATLPGHADFEKTINRLSASWPELKRQKEKIRRIITKSLLFEHSDVSVPANPNALTLAVSKGLKVSPYMLNAMGIKEFCQSDFDPKTLTEKEAEEISEVIAVQVVKKIKLHHVPQHVELIQERDVQQIVHEKIDLLRGGI